MFRLVPPAGTALSIGDITRIKLGWVKRHSKSPQFAGELQKLFGAEHVMPVNSGRAALLLILKAISKIQPDGKNEILLPAYTCFSVAAAVVRSGYSIRLADINPQTMDYDIEKLSGEDFSRVKAILVSSLFGIPNNWARLREIAAGHDIILIDDSAQALGETYDERPSGLNGFAGFYSLGRGKNISTYSGGIIVTHSDELAQVLSELISDLPSPGWLASVGSLYKMGFYSLLSRPRTFWLPASLPFLGIGETIYEESFSVGRLSPAQTCAIPVVMKKLDSLRRIRIDNSRILAERINGVNDMSIPGFNAKDCPGYIRLPVAMPNKDIRDAKVKELREMGIVASTMYPATISEIQELPEGTLCNKREFSGAQNIVDCLLTLPTHPYVAEKDRQKMIACLRA